jgi:hypothetical protein
MHKSLDQLRLFTGFPVMQLPVTSYPVTSRFGDAASGTTSLHHLK